MKRPTFDEIFMGMALWMAQRSPCLSRQVGSVIVKNNRVLATGYNGAPRGVNNCYEKHDKCPRKEAGLESGEYNTSLCPVVHAEENAIVHGAKHGTNLDGSTIYVMYLPCPMCAKSIINAGIEEVVYGEDYPGDLSRNLFEQAGIEVREMPTDSTKEFMRSI